ncbi:POTRA domain-containing protein [Hwangdonia lutea]|uniref:POTRA domain-containing protein n=1 Tax=Hwangdonia lutea TaxID=3075823 RepID=A0AA97HQD2_9FLAO|nr:POTRA domain-containing protein [Hwangdonia sp. SCSIO 19198]WOD42228.1 POTRA domain-containing protein [Hwangdonia sp. SCSIO 19198]
MLGKTEVETRVIDSLNYLKLHKDYASIKLEVDSIQNTLFKMGYIENKRMGIIKKNDSIYTAKFHLKKKYNTIYIYYNNLDVDPSVLKLIAKDVFDAYFILPFNTVENSLAFINQKASEQGKPFSKLRLTNIRTDKNNLKADLIIDSKPEKRTIDHIIIKGYDKFPESYLKHYLKIKPQQTFNLNTIKQKTNLLNDLKFANQIKAPEVLFSKDSTILYIYTKKTKSNSFDGFLGFGTNEDTNKLEFDGYLNLNLSNNLNFGESFSLLYKSDENDQKTFRTDLTLPYLFKSPIGIDLRLQIFKKDSTFTTVNQSAKLHYQINSKHKVFVGVTATTSNNLLSSNSFQNISDYDSNFYTLAYQFLKRQSPNLLFPIKSNLYLETGFGHREASGDKEKQSQYAIDAFTIFNLNHKNSFYFRVNASNLISNTYFENELFRFGGINSIRGFEENSLLASLVGVLNTEYRYQLNNSIFIHSITDVAYFENKLTNTKEKLFGYGFGFGILTKAGLFKFNYANGKTENLPFKFSNSKIHLSLVADF